MNNVGRTLRNDSEHWQHSSAVSVPSVKGFVYIGTGLSLYRLIVLSRLNTTKFSITLPLELSILVCVMQSYGNSIFGNVVWTALTKNFGMKTTF